MGRHKYQGSNWIRKKKREQIYNRDNYRCQYCGSGKSLTLDHVIHTGSHEPTNLLTCCSDCNRRKGRKSVRDWYQICRSRGISIDSRMLYQQRHITLR